MINLAGRKDCDEFIKTELKLAGIRPVYTENDKSEVPYHYKGRISCFDLTRAWYYWVVYGFMPLDIAKEMYETPVGKKDIRVDGHCGCPAPEAPWINYFDENGVQLADISELEKYNENSGVVKSCIASKRYDWVRNPKVGKAFVTTYHIDSQEGLNLFAEFVRKNQIM